MRPVPGPRSGPAKSGGRPSRRAYILLRRHERIPPTNPLQPRKENPNQAIQTTAVRDKTHKQTANKRPRVSKAPQRNERYRSLKRSKGKVHWNKPRLKGFSPVPGRKWTSHSKTNRKTAK